MKVIVLGTLLLQALTAHAQGPPNLPPPPPAILDGTQFTPGPNGPYPPVSDDSEGVGPWDGEDYGPDPYVNSRPPPPPGGRPPPNNDDDEEECPDWCQPGMDNDFPPMMNGPMGTGAPPMMNGPAGPGAPLNVNGAAVPPRGARRDSVVHRAPVAQVAAPAPLQGFQFPQGNNAPSPVNGPADQNEDNDIPDWLAGGPKPTGTRVCPKHCLIPTPTPTAKAKKGKAPPRPPYKPTFVTKPQPPKFTGGPIGEMCPKSCNPNDPAMNKCDITTSCTTTGGKNYMCACRAGYRANSINPKDFPRQAKIPGLPYVYVEAGMKCDSVCADHTCSEVIERPVCK